MPTATVLERVMDDHGTLRERLREWESALAQLTSSAFSESERGLQRIWRLVPFFEKEVPRHFHDEEARLFPALEASHPHSNPALARFSAQHADFLRQWQAYKRELIYCDALRETRQVYELGTGLIGRLRQHMQSEEREFLPLLEKN